MINSKIRNISLAVSSLLIGASHVAFANESEDVERVLVYGALTTTPLSELATSIDVISALDIEQRHAQHLDELFNRSANVNFATGASRGRFVQIRGIGERSQFVDPINPSVGYLVDGINYSGLLAGASTFDVAQVEIFKGPNSARFGADGLAGMINVISAPTSDVTTMDFQAGYANYHSWNLGAAVGGALTNTANCRVSLHQNTSDGFISNTYLNREDTNNQDEFTFRGKVDWQITADLKLNTTVHLIDVDNGYDAFSLDRNRTTLSDEPGVDTQKSDAVALTADYQGFSWADVQVQTSLLDADLSYGYDEDWSYVGIAPGWEYSSTDYYYRTRNDKTVQAKFSSKNNVDTPWLIGFYYADKDENLDRDYTYSAPFSSEVAREDIALFGQYKFDLSDKQWLTASLRLASQKMDYRDSQAIKQSIDHDDWGAELSYHQQTSANTMLYFSVLRSYKMGGVNGQALSKANDEGLEVFKDVLLSNATFGAESLVGTEFGVKGANQDGSLRVDFTLFYQWRDDIQYKNSFVQDQSFVDFYDNAASGTNYGIETSIQAAVTDNLDMFLNLGWLKTNIEGITRLVDDEFETLDKRDQAHAPDYQINAGINWQLSEKVSWLLELDVKDDFYYSFGHDQISDKQFVVHTSLDYDFGDWRISLYARNLFDRAYANRGFYFGNDPRDEYAPQTWEQFGEPRRIGVNLNYHF
ncbi:TonB-dependent receptor [Flavobacterium sp. W21_SRS_FM6]|uniref:TonB-dependent receptor n=1 Tax=Flavobacterium sp. W21_SRS_FM6 TaxID=3240268 RepID=UPI003F926FE4